MFERVTIRVTDVAASERFYDTVLATLGRERTAGGPVWGDFALEAGDPPTERFRMAFPGGVEAEVA